MFFAVLLQDTISIPASLSFSESIELFNKLSLKNGDKSNNNNNASPFSMKTTDSATAAAAGNEAGDNAAEGSKTGSDRLKHTLDSSARAENIRNLFTELINIKYKNRLIADVGLCLALWDLVSFSDPLIFPNDSATHVEVQFRMLVYRPVVNEIIQATVLNIDENYGITASLGFFANIQIPISNLPRPGYYDINKNAWIWQYVDDDEINQKEVADVDEVEAEFEIKLKDRIRLKITHVTFSSSDSTIATTTSSSIGGYPTMAAIGQMKDVGLGPPYWWDQDEQQEAEGADADAEVDADADTGEGDDQGDAINQS